MNVADFLAAFRSDLRDEEPPYLWSDQELVRYLNTAVQEACERAKLIEDVRTITLEPNVSTYQLNPSVFEIKRVTLRDKPLDETSVEALDEECRGWESMKGLPRWFIFEQASGTRPPSLRLVRMPAQVDTLTVTVYRGALKPLSADLDQARPEIPERFHEQLKDWLYRCAYLKHDTETLDRARAAEFEGLFATNFGLRPDANVQRKQRARRPPIVRSNW